MSTETKILVSDPQVLADLDALMRRILDGTPVDPQTSRRIEDRADHITAELRRKYGEMNIAVDLIHEVRNEE